MATGRDYIPLNWAVFAVWFANFIVQLGVLKTKYGVSNDKIAALADDNTWVQFWAEAREGETAEKTGDRLRGRRENG